MKQNRFLLAIIVVLIILNISTLGFFWKLKDGRESRIRGERPHRKEIFFQRKLDLSEEQALKFDESRKSHFNKTEKLREEVGALRAKLNDLMRLEDEDKAEKIIEAIGQKQTEIELLNYKHFNELRSFCNPKQKVIFDSIFTEMTHRSRRMSHRPH